MHNYQKLEYRKNLSVSDFYRNYVGEKSVLFTPYNSSEWSEIKWTEDVLQQIAGHIEICVRPARTKYHSDESSERYKMTLAEYFKYISEWSQDPYRKPIPPYAQDIPLLKEEPALKKNFRYFPLHYLPDWYQKVWPDYPCFFIGLSGSMTPLHFDNCETHNLFFQVHGKKQFFLIDSQDSCYCYKKGWRYSHVDVRNIDYEKFPLFKNAKIYKVLIQPGEILYMPPRTWHQTYATEKNISFNIDWHTPRSAIKGVFAIARGMPPKLALFYNFPHAIGLLTGLPLRKLIRKIQDFALM